MQPTEHMCLASATNGTSLAAQEMLRVPMHLQGSQGVKQLVESECEFHKEDKII
jgi:hypothetical protein